MRFSRLFGRTRREDPAEAETPSHRLLVRAGLIDQLASGLYTMLPLGLRVQRKIEQIVRQELEAAGGQEVLMPVLQPLELWQATGRDADYGQELFRLLDRRERPFVLAPTHEEAVTRLVAGFVRSYRDLPVILYQVQTKLRDEPRPRAGLLRVREFMMIDAYSFDADEAGMDRAFETMRRAYQRLFARCGIDVLPVLADSGAIGGKESVEVVLLAPTGEDTVVRCPNPGCGYAANVEKAEFRRDEAPADVDGNSTPPMEEVSTPGVKTIEQLAAFLGVPPRQTLKVVFYRARSGQMGELVCAGIRGDIEVNEVKLQRLLRCDELRLATDAEVGAAGLVAGSASPVGISGLRTVVDLSVPEQPNLVAGGNRLDVHLRYVNYGRDFTADVVADIGTARAGDGCIRCGEPLLLERAIELGHSFKLGLRYSTAIGAQYLDREGRPAPVWMGCYGLGIGRIMAGAVEAGHDGRGIIWPPAIAPYHLHLVVLNADDAAVGAAAGRLYESLQGLGVEVLLDDRVESAGVKFNDADLLGLPLRATLGPRGLRQGELELHWRATGKVETLTLEGAAASIRHAVEALAPGGPG
jgi:prolyl-tRNA synthetase